MTSRVRSITFDCADPAAVAAFWAAATGRTVVDDGTAEAPEYLLSDPGDPALPNLLFLPVPEGKSVKNRVHLDLQPADRTRDEEVARLLGLGAALLADHRRPDGTGWALLADIEGNEFCVERSAAERAATGG
ncbi:VOC family protein [Kitasatospora sp. NBC_01287]|uniref:VOC family protein n=1 Tax=Kitasatospora sp. NBC_01287 TaxID=2903573 RepID=UPI0022549F87|nr:VOC family protein [Kitasatospora sp. NBC_01287]MCX4747802.1 VOC family protein [Kitasatospora sp. NBC_01287]